MATKKQIEANKKNAKKGGRKKGGKNKRTIEQEKAEGVLREEIRKEWKPLIDAQLDLAKGAYYHYQSPLTGKVRVYKKIPNQKSLDSLIDRVVGKPKETTDLNIRVKALDAIGRAIKKLAEK